MHNELIQVYVNLVCLSDCMKSDFKEMNFINAEHYATCVKNLSVKLANAIGKKQLAQTMYDSILNHMVEDKE